MTIRVSIVVAMGQNRVIGMKNGLPWHIPEDLRRFKALTEGKPVIMGRKTFESILARNGKALPGRTSIVVSRSGFSARDAIVLRDLAAAIDRAKGIASADGKSEIFIIGGGEVFSQALPLADRIYLTVIHASPEGDAWFPDIDPARWAEVSCETTATCSFRTLQAVRL